MPDPLLLYIWFCIYCWWLPVLGLVGLPILRIWCRFSWWWMAVPVGLGGAVLYGLYLLVTSLEHLH